MFQVLTNLQDHGVDNEGSALLDEEGEEELVRLLGDLLGRVLLPVAVRTDLGHVVRKPVWFHTRQSRFEQPVNLNQNYYFKVIRTIIIRICLKTIIQHAH